MPVQLPGGIGFGLHWAWVPFLGFIFGCATILSLLIIWLCQGHPRYRDNESTVVYISDVGADNHALFIVLGTLTAILFFSSIYLDYRLRHTYRIPVRVTRYERAASALSVMSGKQNILTHVPWHCCTWHCIIQCMFMGPFSVSVSKCHCTNAMRRFGAAFNMQLSMQSACCHMVVVDLLVATACLAAVIKPVLSV